MLSLFRIWGSGLRKKVGVQGLRDLEEQRFRGLGLGS